MKEEDDPEETADLIKQAFENSEDPNDIFEDHIIEDNGI